MICTSRTVNYPDILQNLVSFDTTTGNGNFDAVLWVKSYLEQFSISAELLYNADKTNAALWAKVGTSNNNGIIFSGHLDVVPKGSGWNYPAFALTETDDKFYGRGSVDMKGAIAVMLSLIPEMLASNRTFYICLTPDEESVSEGIQTILSADFFDKNNFLGCIVMEATQNKLVIGHKSVQDFEIILKGKSAHSSTPLLGVNALSAAVDVYRLFYQLFQPYVEQKDMNYTVQNSVADITIFNAGTTLNIIPDIAILSGCVRFIKQTDQEFFMSKLQSEIKNYVQKIDGLNFSFTSKSSLPALNSNLQSDFIQELLKYIELSSPSKVSYGTEAGFISQHNISTVVCGPGSIEQAHKPDEFVEKTELLKFKNLLLNIIR